MNSIDLSKLKKDDIIYAINNGLKPIIYEMKINNIIIDEHVFSMTYNINVIMPDNSHRFIEFYIPSKTNFLIKNKAYIKSLNKSIISEYNENNTVILGFEKNIVIDYYINSIKKHIELVEETIKRGKVNLIELNEKLNYVQNQRKNFK